MNKALVCRPVCSPGNTTAVSLTPFAEDKSKAIFERREDYHAIRYSKTQWLVMHKNGRNKHRSNKETSNVSFEDCFSIPAFTNVYNVSLCLTSKKMSCSCGTITRIGMPCQHVYHITQERTPEMFHIRWHTIYNSLKTEVSKELQALMNDLRTEHYNDFSSVYVGSFLNRLEEFESINLDIPTHVGVEMLYVYLSHLDERAVKKSDVVKVLPRPLQNKCSYELLKLHDYLYGNTVVKDEDFMEDFVPHVASEESNPDHIVSRKKERTQSSTMELDKMRYYKLMEKFRQFAKLGEGRPEIYEEILKKMDEMTIEFTHRAIETDKHLQKEDETRKSRGLVSSNAATECNPNRGRYKGSHELK